MANKINKLGVSIVSRGYFIDSDIYFPLLEKRFDDLSKYLVNPKSVKYMSKQDIQAVYALGSALENFDYNGSMTGIYMSVGYIPFDESSLINIAKNSTDKRKFSMKKFVSHAITDFNPLSTFKCLTNMPIYHCSVNYKIKGPYFVTHPAIGEFYQALNRAISDLKSGLIDTAIVGATADFSNYLAKNRLQYDIGNNINTLNGSAFIIIENTDYALKNNRTIIYKLINHELSYNPAKNEYYELFNSSQSDIYMGPSSLCLYLNTDNSKLTHDGQSYNGYKFNSVWEIVNEFR